MNDHRLHHCAADRLAWLVLAAGLMLPWRAAGAAEQQLEVLQTKTVTYTNVTVMTKATNYVFITHAAGMTSLRVADLPLEAKLQLGYATTNVAKGRTNTAAVWAKREIAKLDVPQVKALRKDLYQHWQAYLPAKLSLAGLMEAKALCMFLGVTLLVYLFFSYCCMLICRKTGNPPGILVWLPVLKIFPLLRAAGMSGWWFVALFVPVLNIIPAILWPFKIAEARGKSAWIAVLLLLPVTDLFAFLYLAFSTSRLAEEDEASEPKIMTLAAA